jgi:GH24 family phage-related lysozyme (muramidase)
MNRKIRIKYYYKIASNKPMSMRQKLLGGMMGLGTATLVGNQLPSNELEPEENASEEVAGEVAQNQRETKKELGYVDYTIKPGDNIFSISKKLFPGYTNRAQLHIMEINNLNEESSRKLIVGDTIKVPSSKDEFTSYFGLDANEGMKASGDIIDYIKHIETLHELPTKVEVSSNIKTVGYGRRLNTQKKIDAYNDYKKVMLSEGRRDLKLRETDPIIMSWMMEDINEAESKIKMAYFPSLTQNQFDALISFVYNTGHTPDIKDYLLNNDIESAAKIIRNYSNKEAKDKAGLPKRRAYEADLFLK